MCVAVCVGLSGLVAPASALPLYGCCRLPHLSTTSIPRFIYDRFQAPLSPGLLRLPPLGGFGGGGFERSPAAADFGLDLASVAAVSPGVGVLPPPVPMLLRPTPHYAVTGGSAGAPADMAATLDANKAAGGGGSGWMLAKSLSIAELRLRAQQYAAVLGTR